LVVGTPNSDVGLHDIDIVAADIDERATASGHEVEFLIG
jgi:hypothetical protein